MCANCVRPVKDVYYCEDCLAKVMGVTPGAPVPAGATPDLGAPPTGIPAPQIPPPANAPNPGLAFLLGLVPGLGAIHVGMLIRRTIRLLAFAAGAVAVVVWLQYALAQLPWTRGAAASDRSESG